MIPQNMAQFQVRFSLQWQFLVTVGLFALFLAGLPAFTLMDFTQRRLHDDQDMRAQLLLDSLGGNIADALVQQDSLALSDAVQRVLGKDDILAITVYDENLKVVYHADGLEVLTHQGVVERPELKERLLDGPENAALFASNRLAWRSYRYQQAPLKAYQSLGRGGQRVDYSLPLTTVAPLVPRQLGLVRITYSTRRSDEALFRTRVAMGLGLGALVLLALVGTFLLSRQITGPIRVLAAHVKRVGDGALDERLTVRRRDELGLLAAEFDQMTGNLQKAQKALVARAQTERDLELAARIQTSLLPETPWQRGSLSVSGFSLPAREMGGDYYDVFELGGDRSVVLISDVSGKGVSAALIMVMLKTALQVAVASGAREPARLAALANRLLHRQTSAAQYATMHLAVIHHLSGEVFFTNAGHGTLRVYRAATGQFEEFNQSAIPLGMSAETAFTQDSLTMAKGDFLLLYTDGLTEARGRDGNRYGWTRLGEVATRSALGGNATTVLNEILKDHGAFRGDGAPADDLTLLVACFSGPAEESAKVG